jgi:hypothetical protein
MLAETHILVQSSHNPLSHALVSYYAVHEHRLFDFEHIHIPCLDDCTFGKKKWLDDESG